MSDLQQKTKILILGSPGAGKTVLAKKLAMLLGVPVIHLDDYYWLPNWVRRDHDEWLKLLQQLCIGSHWVMDGNHAVTLSMRVDYADHVILLDYSVLKCLFYYAIRSIRRYLGCADQLPKAIASAKKRKRIFTINWRMIRLILGFKLITRPKMLKIIHARKISIIRIKSRKVLNKTDFGCIY